MSKNGERFYLTTRQSKSYNKATKFVGKGDIMATTIYLIRHGQSLGNLEGRFLGHTDWDLTELGVSQAECTASFFDDIHLDAVYASDLKRAFNTAKAIADKKKLSVIPEKRFRELYAGKWEMMRFEDIPKEFPDSWRDWQNANTSTLRAPEGESMQELFERVYAALLQIAEKHDGQAVAIGLHATPIRLVLNHIAKRDLCELYKTPWVSNASVTALKFENSEFTVIFSDECAHLGEIKTTLPSGV